jgi:hypothetical protein
MSANKNDFASLLSKSIKKVTSGAQSDAVSPAVAVTEVPESIAVEPAPVVQEKPAAAIVTQAPRKVLRQRVEEGSDGRNTNRVTLNLFEADKRALGVIKELLGSVGHDFTSRSDSMKVGLRLAAKARPEELAKLYEEVKAEDRRSRRGA